MERVRSAEQRQKDDAEIREMVKRVNDARNTFEEQYTFATLRLVDRDLHDKLQEQLSWFHESAVVNTQYQAIEEGEASLRGIAAATELLDNCSDEEVVVWSDDLEAHLVIRHDRRQARSEIVITPAEIISWLKNTPHILDMKRRAPGCEISYGQKV